jgi:hypothetical protein
MLWSWNQHTHKNKQKKKKSAVDNVTNSVASLWVMNMAYGLHCWIVCLQIKTEPLDFDFISIDEEQFTSSITVVRFIILLYLNNILSNVNMYPNFNMFLTHKLMLKHKKKKKKKVWSEFK